MVKCIDYFLRGDNGEEMEGIIRILLRCAAGILLGLIMGNGAVWFFNKIPGRWLCNYDEEPDEELLNPTVQRVRSTPWKYLFTALFACIGIWLFRSNVHYAFAAMCLCWVLLEMAIADIKYMIVPDQLIFLTMAVAVGFIPFHERGPLDCALGAAVGLGVMMLMVLIGWILYRKNTIGGGDIKLMTALGLVLGSDGIITVFLLSTLLSAMHFVYLLMRKRVKITDKKPMVPYIAVSAGIYVVLLQEMGYNILIAFNL